MQPGTMISFEPFQSENKDLSYSALHQDPHSDSFDQFFNFDSSQSTNDIEAPQSYESFDFGFDDATTSQSYVVGGAGPIIKHPQPISPASIPFVHEEDPQPLRSRRLSKQQEPSSPAISGSQLLSLEGKAYSTPASPPPSAAPTLRRKGKFCTNGPEPKGRTHRVSKTLSNDMIRASSRNSHDMSSYQEWTQKFEQISLKASEAGLAMPLSSSTNGAQKMDPSAFNAPFTNPFTHRKTVSENAASPYLFRPTQIMGHSPRTSHPATPGSPVQMPVEPGSMAGSYINGMDDFTQNFDNSIRHSRQPASWGQAPSGYVRHDVTISPGHVHPSWLHTLPEKAEAYPAQSSLQATGLPEYVPDAAIPYDPYGLHHNPEPSNTYPVYLPPDMASNNRGSSTYTNGNSAVTNLTHPHTSPPLTPSPSPPAQDPPNPGPRSKPQRRRPRLGTLRLPNTKSSSTLRSAKSGHNLRSPKSAGALKSPKSINGLKSPGEFGFVNFTPDDKRKILTGVAPSGSSKTKARRELEAQDKKRRLSQAAFKAIAEAGGDVEALKGGGLDDLLF